MKYLKIYETYNQIVNLNNPEMWDYVLCEEESDMDNELKSFISNNIGMIIKIEKSFYYILYENITPDISKYFIAKKNTNDKHVRVMEKHEIKYWSKNKEKLEMYIKANKYNI